MSFVLCVLLLPVTILPLVAVPWSSFNKHNRYNKPEICPRALTKIVKVIEDLVVFIIISNWQIKMLIVLNFLLF